MLTKEQLIERRKGIGASDASRILDPTEWPALWAEKVGKSEGKDLSDVFAVQLGHATEALNLDWYERRVGNPVTRRGDAVLSYTYPFLRCTLDGFDDKLIAVVQAKHVNAYSKMDEVVLRYTPQVTHEMIVTGARKAILSVIVGTNEPVREEVPYDEFFAIEYIAKAKEFWGYVERNEEPPGSGEALAAPTPPAIMRRVDMTGSNEWADAAVVWLDNRKQAKLFDVAATSIKKMIEPDVCEAKGHGIVASRNKAGSLSIKESA